MVYKMRELDWIRYGEKGNYFEKNKCVLLGGYDRWLF